MTINPILIENNPWKPFERYSYWLASHGDKLCFKKSDYANDYLFNRFSNDYECEIDLTGEVVKFYIYNFCSDGFLDIYNRGVKTQFKCGRRSHNCAQENHLDFFRNVAENWFRRYAFKVFNGIDLNKKD